MCNIGEIMHVPLINSKLTSEHFRVVLYYKCKSYLQFSLVNKTQYYHIFLFQSPVGYGTRKILGQSSIPISITYFQAKILPLFKPEVNKLVL